MIDPKSVSEELLFNTIRIATDTGCGTGFIYDAGGVPLLITNKHVIEKTNKAQISLHIAAEKKPTGKSFDVNFENFQSLWIYHTDRNIDLCALPLGPVLNQLQTQGVEIFYKHFVAENIWSDEKLKELFAIEEVIMAGYPIGLYDHHNNLPIFRRGITASHPAVDFGGKSSGVIDAACFPGSSGSPILILNEGGYASKHGMCVGANRIILLGVLFSGPKIEQTGKVEIINIPMQQVSISKTDMMIHLGYYIKAKEILTLAADVRKMAGVNEAV